MIEKDDNELVYEVIHGSISSFEILIERYQNTVFNMVLRMVNERETALDLTQDVFIKAFEKMGSFNFKYRFFSWIYRIAANETINYLKSQRRFESLSKVERAGIAEEADTGREARSKKLHLGLKLLRADQRLLILLKYYFGLSYEEMAETLGLPEKKIKARLFTAREKLKDELLKNDFFDEER
ncbi:MAG: sigma-70 family RNA polymerase sigma factor [bacterium]